MCANFAGVGIEMRATCPRAREEKMSVTISFRCDQDQARAMRERAREVGMTVGQYARWCSIHAATLDEISSEISRMRDEARESAAATRAEILAAQRDDLKKVVNFLAEQIRKSARAEQEGD